MVFPRILLLLAASIIVYGKPIARRGVIPTDKIVGLAEAVPDDINGTLYKIYQPYLDVVNGCVPYPAVDVAGNTNRGLSHHGTETGGCTNSPGQVYVRGMATDSGRYALMYAWYMPKDVPSRGLGHRHEWEGAIIWLASPNSNDASNILAVCPSAHGKWNCNSNFRAKGTGALISYSGKWPLNHSMWLSTKVGKQHPLIAWESLPEVARASLQSADFKTGTVPFKNGPFESNIASARV